MKILEVNGGLLTNFEVLQVLKDRGADALGPNARARPSEKTAFECLTRAAASVHKREAVAVLIDALRPFGLVKAEILQIINQAPRSPVEVHLIVEDCDARLNDEQMDELLGIVEQHLPPPQ